jgi:hypothetical protein
MVNEPKDERFRKAEERLKKTVAEEIKAAYEPTPEELADMQDKSWTKEIRRDDGLKEAPTPEYVLMIFETDGTIRWAYLDTPIVPIDALQPGEMGMIVLPIVSRARHGHGQEEG